MSHYLTVGAADLPLQRRSRGFLMECTESLGASCLLTCPSDHTDDDGRYYIDRTDPARPRCWVEGDDELRAARLGLDPEDPEDELKLDELDRPLGCGAYLEHAKECSHVEYAHGHYLEEIVDEPRQGRHAVECEWEDDYLLITYVEPWLPSDRDPDALLAEPAPSRPASYHQPLSIDGGD